MSPWLVVSIASFVGLLVTLSAIFVLRRRITLLEQRAQEELQAAQSNVSSLETRAVKAEREALALRRLWGPGEPETLPVPSTLVSSQDAWREALSSLHALKTLTAFALIDESGWPLIVDQDHAQAKSLCALYGGLVTSGLFDETERLEVVCERGQHLVLLRLVGPHKRPLCLALWTTGAPAPSQVLALLQARFEGLMGTTPAPLAPWRRLREQDLDGAPQPLARFVQEQDCATITCFDGRQDIERWGLPDRSAALAKLWKTLSTLYQARQALGLGQPLSVVWWSSSRHCLSAAKAGDKLWVVNLRSPSASPHDRVVQLARTLNWRQPVTTPALPMKQTISPELSAPRAER